MKPTLQAILLTCRIRCTKSKVLSIVTPKSIFVFDRTIMWTKRSSTDVITLDNLRYAICINEHLKFDLLLTPL